MKLSRHAKNKARHAKLSMREVNRLFEEGVEAGMDRSGNRLMACRSDRGIEILLVVALDDPEYIITLMERRRR